MRIPEIRDSLVVLAIKLAKAKMPEEAKECLYLMEQLKRRPAERAPIESRTMTPEIEQEIIQLRAANPKWTQNRIAKVVGVHSGRVSETLRGKRT